MSDGDGSAAQLHRTLTLARLTMVALGLFALFAGYLAVSRGVFELFWVALTVGGFAMATAGMVRARRELRRIDELERLWTLSPDE